MSASDKKDKNFDWKQGQVLDDDNYDPLGDVRVRGLPKLKKATHADPVKRKQEREELILSKQSKPYKSTVKKDDDLVIEESQSGLSEDYESTEAKKLIDQGGRFKGVDRFGKNKNNNKKK
jgi:hypothetical protein